MLISISFIFIAYYLYAENTNPYKDYDICFIRDCPRATSRLITYTPVRCSDKSIILGEPIGTDYANIIFKDIDGDNLPEIIVEPSKWRCCISANCYDARRIILKVILNSPPKFKIISVERLEDVARDISQ